MEDTEREDVASSYLYVNCDRTNGSEKMTAKKETSKTGPAKNDGKGKQDVEWMMNIRHVGVLRASETFSHVLYIPHRVR